MTDRNSGTELYETKADVAACPAGPSDSPTYSSYLHVDELLELQTPRSSPEHPDELHFIVTHQAMELWFKVMLHELSRVQEYLEKQIWTQALAKLSRVNLILQTQTAQMGTLCSLDPWAFQQFRGFLGSASGFQSVQFRALELLSGLRDPSYIARLSRDQHGRLPEPLDDILSKPSLAETASRAAGAADVGGWSEVYSDPELHGPLFLIGEALLEYDRQWVMWRQEHLLLVARVIGPGSTGTGGGSSAYLQKRIDIKFFPFLWDVRDSITASWTERRGDLHGA